MWISILWVLLVPFSIPFVASFGRDPDLAEIVFRAIPIVTGIGGLVSAAAALIRRASGAEDVVVAVNCGLLGAAPAAFIILVT